MNYKKGQKRNPSSFSALVALDPCRYKQRRTTFRWAIPSLHMEVTRLDGVIRLYARMVRRCYVRFEKGNYVINRAMEQAITSTVNGRGK